MGGHCIHDLVQSDTYWSDKTRGSVMQTVVQTVAQVQGQKDIYEYK